MDASTQTSPSGAVRAETITRYADLLVRLGANVQPGQIVEVAGTPAHAPLVRAAADAAYRAGARYVDARYFDPQVRRARIVHAPAAEALEFVPAWERERVLALGEERCARVVLTPLLPPGLFDDLDAGLVAREPLPSLPESLQIVMAETTNWTAAPAPEPLWATRVHPDLPADEALARLWEDVEHVCRLDEPDPEQAWRTRFAQLAEPTGRLNEARFDALHFRGPGTDLTVGLFPTSRWTSGRATTVAGIEHSPNLPTEELFTAPDPSRADGVVTSTRPLVLKSGARVDGLVVRFEGGRAVDVQADAGLDALRALLGRDEGATRLGEVALVDGDSRVGALDTVFWSTLLDENAASHLALGHAYPRTVGEGERQRANRSEIHVDFMIGGDDVEVTALARDGSSVPVLRGGAWAL
ncbi:MAG: aminopeptidase [Thermoleophilia bacterium]|nr:aminopeptidase [Thermoleophilia bacterium]